MRSLSLYIKLLPFILVFLLINSCRKEYSANYNPDWSLSSHGEAVQDYSVVFPQNSVNMIEISMTSSQWNSIRNNMKSLFGKDFGVSGIGNPGAGGPGFPDEETGYIDILLKFNGKSWKKVGFRLKGNSSLQRAWSSGIYKLPFRLDFDKFEDTYPGIKDQHFYGFKELSFSPAFSDQSLMREKITPDIFRLAGIPAAQTAFYRVYIDFGSGSEYCGVYTAVEIPDDNMIKDQFGEESGNIYKPESRLNGFVKSEFPKKNNEISADYSDIQGFLSALNSSLRIVNPEQWRAGLETVFNVDHFIKYLAVNNTIVNWDSYGIMAHNFYLYNHSVNKLTWIPWDHNEAMTGSPGITGTISGGGQPGGVHTGLSLSMNEITTNWPLIRYIADDPVYLNKYKDYLRWFRDSVFTETSINELIDKYFIMISPYAVGINGELPKHTYLSNSSSFTIARTDLKSHVVKRRTLITTYVQ